MVLEGRHGRTTSGVRSGAPNGAGGGEGEGREGDGEKGLEGESGRY